MELDKFYASPFQNMLKVTSEGNIPSAVSVVSRLCSSFLGNCMLVRGEGRVIVIYLIVNKKLKNKVIEVKLKLGQALIPGGLQL